MRALVSSRAISVMAGLVPAIYVYAASRRKAWMPGTADKFTQSAQA